MPETSTDRNSYARDDAEVGLTLSVVVAFVAAILLVLAVLFTPAQKSVDVSINQPSTGSPATGDTKTP